MAKDLAIVLSSGSLNSAVAATLAAQRYRLVMVFADAQAPSPLPSRRRQAYDAQVSHFRPYREETLAMPFLSRWSGDAERVPSSADPRHRTAVAQQLLEVTPILGAAARLAGQFEAAAVYTGLRVGPASDDLAAATEFLQVWAELLQWPCGLGEVEMAAPLLELEPWQVVDVGVQVGAPLEKSWSCLEEGETACGRCPGCRDRDSAFTQAGKADPLRPIKR